VRIERWSCPLRWSIATARLTYPTDHHAYRQTKHGVQLQSQGQSVVREAAMVYLYTIDVVVLLDVLLWWLLQGSISLGDRYLVCFLS